MQNNTIQSNTTKENTQHNYAIGNPPFAERLPPEMSTFWDAQNETTTGFHKSEICFKCKDANLYIYIYIPGA